VDLELVTIGTELLLGFTIDTNAAELGRRLSAAGVRIARRTTVADRPAEIRDAVAAALARTGFVLTTGGLGPTRDDMTKTVVAELYGQPLRFDETVWRDLQERFRLLGRALADRNRCQAEIPERATVLRNPWGTAPGLWIEDARGVVVMLPGVPLEMRNLLEHEVMPRLAQRAGSVVIRSRVLRTSQIAESALAAVIGDTEDALAPVTLAYLPGTEGVDLRLTAWSVEADVAEAELARAAELLRHAVGKWIYAEGETSLPEVVLECARQKRWTIGAAESCTGGLLGARLTDVPGSSDVFAGAIVSYANGVKSALLDVPAALIAEHGAVSEPVVRAMAAGARARLGTDLAVAITGVAGPGGGSEEKPVGTVWLAVAGPDGVQAVKQGLPGTRPEVRLRASQAALWLLRLALA
jgi:nicotinamide-nucleotide amidase